MAGLDHATLLGEFDATRCGIGFTASWAVYAGKIISLTLHPEKINVEDKAHPVMKGIPLSFVIEKEEWYTKPAAQ